MFVYNPKTLFYVWPAFYAFIDFLIRMINEDKVEVTSNSFFGTDHGPADFYIWFSASKGINEESKIHLSYDWWLGFETATPIERFGFSLVGKGIVLAELRSKDARSYDKMLDLFKAVMRYMERHDPKYHQEVLGFVGKATSSMERKDWKKSKAEIEKEFSERWETRKAAEDFERERATELSKLTNDYRSQGYEITD